MFELLQGNVSLFLFCRNPNTKFEKIHVDMAKYQYFGQSFKKLLYRQIQIHRGGFFLD